MPAGRLFGGDRSLPLESGQPAGVPGWSAVQIGQFIAVARTGRTGPGSIVDLCQNPGQPADHSSMGAGLGDLEAGADDLESVLFVKPDHRGSGRGPDPVVSRVQHGEFRQRRRKKVGADPAPLKAVADGHAPEPDLGGFALQVEWFGQVADHSDDALSFGVDGGEMPGVFVAVAVVFEPFVLLVLRAKHPGPEGGDPFEVDFSDVDSVDVYRFSVRPARLAGGQSVV